MTDTVTKTAKDILTPTEDVLARIFSDVLGIEKPGARDPVDLCWDSPEAIGIIERAVFAFAMKVDPRIFHGAACVADVAEKFKERRNRAGADRRRDATAQEGGSKTWN